ncbi:MAG TPA: ParA family protein [Chromatiales bacterium]|nr:ParA family protein [Chromatiales bacterium]
MTIYRVDERLKGRIMQSVLLLNAKGGSGKTTIATNLASLYASAGFKTAILDYDPQGSSHYWGSLRDSTEHAPVHIIDASHKRTGITRAFQLKTPPDTERVIIDTPAGISRDLLREAVDRADIIVIPVTPSPIDIHASAEFIRELMLTIKMRAASIPIGIIANRVRQQTPIYQPLERFLDSQDIPFLATLSDSDHYISASEKGVGIHEMEPSLVTQERIEWAPLVKWIGEHLPHTSSPGENLLLRAAAN